MLYGLKGIRKTKVFSQNSIPKLTKLTTQLTIIFALDKVNTKPKSFQWTSLFHRPSKLKIKLDLKIRQTEIRFHLLVLQNHSKRVLLQVSEVKFFARPNKN